MIHSYSPSLPARRRWGRLWSLLLASPGTTATNGGGAWDASVRTGGRPHDCRQYTPPQHIPAHSKAITRSDVVEGRLKALGLVSIGALRAENDGNCSDGRWTPAGRLLRQYLSLLIPRLTDHTSATPDHHSIRLGLRFPNHLHSPQTVQYSWRTVAISKGVGRGWSNVSCGGDLGSGLPRRAEVER